MIFFLPIFGVVFSHVMFFNMIMRIEKEKEEELKREKDKLERLEKIEEDIKSNKEDLNRYREDLEKKNRRI